MKADIVENDNVAGRQGRGELRFDPGLEDAVVHRRIDDPGRSQSVASEAGDKGLRFPLPERRMGVKALAFAGPAGPFGKFGVGRCLIDKDQPRQCFVEEAPASSDPEITGAGDLRAGLFACPQAFFYGSAQADAENG